MLGSVLEIIDQPIADPADITNHQRPRRRWRDTREVEQPPHRYGSCAGQSFPRIRAGAMIRIEGVGPDFSGDYRVSSATHTIRWQRLQNSL